MKEVLGSEISEPPLVTSYQALLQNNDFHSHLKTESIVVQEIDLPVINLYNIQSENREKRRLCAEEIVKAASEWGFFQVLNHGISLQLLEEIKREQVKLFRLPFEKKVSSGILNDSYRWGNPTAVSVDQFSWSEAFHVPLDKISDEDCNHGEFSSLRELMKNLGMAMSNLGRALADVLVQNLGYSCGNFPKNCDEKTCFLRLNRYPPCPFSRPETGAACGLVSHTDSDYLTILYQDHVGGLQVMKDSRWVAVRPNRNALIVNIGDLFQVSIFFISSFIYFTFCSLHLQFVRFQLIYIIYILTPQSSVYCKFKNLNLGWVLNLGHFSPTKCKANPSLIKLVHYWATW
ncbi:hypothetical protein LUZ63_001820 [Rhynchospora breviuscula]|uniref:Fe2OG dioxygenase domain-containing protein n=1 Tax=Rhynchospora breviuscula TaxID=2022672 RepID=A0A9Q0HXF7_9POAL|nr:hypothetical protein LUZ63_001820 [Rhynchospora breviuscula]